MSRPEMAQAFRQLEVLYNAGIQLAPSVSSVARGEWSPLVSEGLNQVQQDLHDGRTLSWSLARQPHLFDGTAVGLVAELMERQVRIRQRIRAALTYPVIVATLGTLGIGCMLMFFLPRVADLAQSPLLRTISNPWLLGGAAETVVAVAVLAWFWARTETGAALFDRTVLGVPVLGRMVRGAGQARFCHALSLMLGCGAPLLQALELAPASLGNREMVEAVRRAGLRLVQQGGSLTECFRQEEWFDPTFMALLAVGEETARLEPMLARLALLCEEDFELQVSNCTALLEPLLLCGLGAAVAAGILILFVPLAQMTQL